MTGVATTGRPGDYIVVATDGWEASVIRGFQWYSANKADRDGAWANHVALIGHGCLWEAQPGKGKSKGFQPAPLDKYDRFHHAISSRPLTETQRFGAVAVAEGMQGIRYNWLDIAALGFSALGAVPDPVWERLNRPDRLICSQAVAHIYRTVGDPLTAGPAELDCRVTPAHLARGTVLRGGTP